MTKAFESIWDREDYGMLVPDSPWYRMLFRLQDAFVKSSFKFYTDEGLSYIPMPVTTNAVSSPMGLGSDSLPVEIELNGRKVYLADSMQFLLEYGCRLSEKGCFYLMPSFRGEECDKRHLSQFYHSEAEIKGNIEDIILLVERYLKTLCTDILTSCGDCLLKNGKRISQIERMAEGQSIPRIQFRDAVKMLEVYHGAVTMLSSGDKNITPQGEMLLIEKSGGCVWLTSFPEKIVPFYQASSEGTARNADLLMGIGETVGAGERHRNSQDLCAALERHEVSPEPYEWYVKMKERSPLTIAGFGWKDLCSGFLTMMILEIAS